MDWSIIVPYIIGTLMGLFFGYKRGIRLGAELTIVNLCTQGYVKFTGNPADSDVQLFKHDEEIPQEK